MSQQFIYQVEQIPPGVHPLQLDFLHEASIVGAFNRLKAPTAEVITQYFTTEATYSDLAREHGITVPAVRERITRGIAQMRRVLYQEKPELAQEDKYPLEQIKRGKDRLEVLRSDKSRIRSSDAQRNRPLTQATHSRDIFIEEPHRSEHNKL